MLDIVKLSEDLSSKLQHETDLLMSDRLMTRDVLEARTSELNQKRADELRRVDEWADRQKTLIKEVFSAMLAEIEADQQRNEANISRMKGELPDRNVERLPERTKPAKAERHLKAAE